MQRTSKEITKHSLTTASGQYIFPQALITLVEKADQNLSKQTVQFFV